MGDASSGSLTQKALNRGSHRSIAQLRLLVNGQAILVKGVNRHEIRSGPRQVHDPRQP